MQRRPEAQGILRQTRPRGPESGPEEDPTRPGVLEEGGRALVTDRFLGTIWAQGNATHRNHLEKKRPEDWESLGLADRGLPFS